MFKNLTIFFLIFLFKPIAHGVSEMYELDELSPMDQDSEIIFPYNTPPTDKKYNFEGIVSLSNCSGFLIKLQGHSFDKALLMTNGHCIGQFQESGTALYDKPSSRSVTILDSDSRSMGHIKTTKLVYSTMTGTDLAIYELDHSYEEIQDEFGVKPLIISILGPAKGSKIEILSGYWKEGYSCKLDDIINRLHESHWIWRDSLKYTKSCHTRGGASGSPIISKDQGVRQVIGIHNTRRNSGRSNGCTLNNPCEKSKHGITKYGKGKSYGQNTYWIYNCIDENSKTRLELDFSRAECLLTKPTSLVPATL